MSQNINNAFIYLSISISYSKIFNRPLIELLESIQKRLGIFFSLSEAIAKLDMLLAFATYSLNHPRKCGIFIS